jgi:hypothetical protein
VKAFFNQSHGAANAKTSNRTRGSTEIDTGRREYSKGGLGLPVLAPEPKYALAVGQSAFGSRIELLETPPQQHVAQYPSLDGLIGIAGFATKLVFVHYCVCKADCILLGLSLLLRLRSPLGENFALGIHLLHVLAFRDGSGTPAWVVA